MLKKVVKRFRKISNIKKNVNNHYIRFCSLPVDDKLVLLEGGQGTNINGNMFSMLREINTNPRWSEYKTVFVVTEMNFEKAENRMAFYGFDRVILCVRNSKTYCKYLACAKYLLTDNSFPPYFHKRENQVFLNTWHGTPLKNLGKSDKSNYASLANIQKNYLMSDYALFPNEFTRGVFMNDYDLKRIFKGKSLIANYPRNYIFYDKEQSSIMKDKLGFSGKKVFAYMPTWRGTGRVADTKSQLEITQKILEEFDSALDDDTVLLVNLHFLLASGIDCSSFSHIEYFPSDYDTYEILNACDGLITDYSSVFFDYAVTGKKIILFAYDKAKYLSSRGVYIPFESLPFPIVESVDAVVDEMNVASNDYGDFIKEYCPNGSIDSCELLFELMVTGETKAYKLEKQENAGEKICLIFADLLNKSYFDSIKEYISQNPGYNYVITYRKNLNKLKKDFILSLNDDISTLGIVTALQFKKKELIAYSIKRMFKSHCPRKINDILSSFFEREAQRLLYSIEPEKIIDFSCTNIVMAGIFSKMTGEKTFVKHGNCIAYSERAKKSMKAVKSFEKENGFVQTDLGEFEDNLFIKKFDGNPKADCSYSKLSCMKNIFPLYMKHKNRLICLSMFYLKTPVKIKLSDIWLTVGGTVFEPKYYALSKKPAKRHFGIYKLTLSINDVIDLPSSNCVAVNYNNPLNAQVVSKVVYNAIFMNRFFGLRSPMIIDKKTSTVAIFRQSRKNRLYVYVRSYNVSDSFSKQVMQTFAFILSLLWHGKKARELVLLFEKNSAKYEESASVTFEELLNSGYKHAYFIITADALGDVPEKYRNNVLIKHSFKHYLYFFKAHTFIGTETLVHAIDLKTFNRLALLKVACKNKNYVFLQHGVMYMVSLDSEARKMFKRKNLKGKYRVVVSSQAEANHFTALGNHYEEDMYISGLPKFDKNIMNPDADKIVVMPTWRPWEINTARDNFLETSYFKMIMKIYSSVPDNLKDKVMILPHPLIINELKNLPESVSDTIVMDAKYDLVLRQARILITDYSSIAYDAFYRGCRVIFYWEEKDECLSHYGPTTKLMLNEDNVYGDFFYNTDFLEEAIEYNYYHPQKQEYIDKYREIVSFHDGKNTQRLIEFLKKDGII